VLSRAAKRQRHCPRLRGPCSARRGRSSLAAAELGRVGPFGLLFLSGPRVTIEGMELTGRDFDRIPPRNLRVPVVEFARLWLAAERQYDQDRSWSTFGVVQTCRWLATATVRPADGQCYLADAPVTNRFGQAHEETIEAEALAAEVLLFRRPVAPWLLERPGWLLSVVKTLAWAWHRSGVPPLEVPAPHQG